MSNVSAVVEFIATKISGLATPPIASRHFYDLSKNDGVKNSFIYAIRPGSADPVSGPVGRRTFEQDFEIEFAKEFKELSTNDEAIRDCVESIHQFGEGLMAAMVGRPVNSNILLIKDPSFSKPEVDQNRKSVSITYTYQIQHFVRGVSP
jgi:hypothetical protein